MIIYDILLILQYQVSTTVVDFVVFSLCLYLCLKGKGCENKGLGNGSRPNLAGNRRPCLDSRAMVTLKH